MTGQVPDTQADAPLPLTTPIEQVPGVTAPIAAGLRAMGLSNIGRLVAHVPHRYEREEAEAPIEDLLEGQIVSARGEVTACRASGYGRRKRFEAVLMDDTGRLELVWFNAPYMQGKLHPGMNIKVKGKARMRDGALQLANPQCEFITGDDAPAAESRLRPVYPASERVPSAQIERAIRLVLDGALAQIEDHLPDELRRSREMPALAEAYRALHAPETETDASEARRRLAYDELLLFQLAVFVKRWHLRDRSRAPALRASEEVDRMVREMLPHVPTEGQETALRELRQDLTRDIPTNRLIQGDVGSGKTMVALYAMLLAVASDQQAAIVAPTEILAEQHFAALTKILAGTSVKTALISGSMSDADRGAARAGLASGEINLAIGTHALLSEGGVFRSLGVAVIDEQHRFGVYQRSAFRSGEPDEHGRVRAPHVLVMTATPIPRTLGLTLFGDLDVSSVRGLPPGRAGVKTRVATPDMRDGVYQSVRDAVARGEQAFVVVPAIDTGATSDPDSEDALVDLRSLMTELERGPLAGTRIAALHGRLARDTREHVMERFRSGMIDVLVATTVVEVGVDVPNATLMVIEHAERFGIAQLHQLRGRVGRGSLPGECVLIRHVETDEARRRLGAVESSTDGFELAEQDFLMRGPGEVFGTRQSGMPPFRVADLARDGALLALARQDAQNWVQRSPRLDTDEERVINRRVFKAHGPWLGLGDVG